MTKDRFVEILKEYDYPQGAIEALWRTRPEDDLDEEKLRATAAAYRCRALSEYGERP